ncbi:MAG: hypothetical protein ACTSUO_02360 [Candidatus Thorarchaeota archaeon]
MAKKSNIIVVGGDRITTEIRELDIFELKYWRENPRVDSIIKQKFPTSEVVDGDIEQELWELGSVKDLYTDIKQNKGLIDEILVKGDVVLEGNSRLCAYRHLYQKSTNDEEKKRWRTIRARIIPDDTDNEAIFTILGTWHIKGKAEWRTFEKAAYLYRMQRDYGKTPNEIAAMVKQKKADVKNMIASYKTMQEKGITETKEQKKFSAIFEIIKNRKMKDLKDDAPDLFDKCIEAVKNNRFERAEQVRDLPKVIKDKKARKLFFQDGGDFQDALDIAKARHPEHKSSFYNQLRKVTKILRDCPVKRIEEIKKDGNKQFILKQLLKAAENVCKKAGIKK